MFKRPAFLDRFLSQLPDLRSLRFQSVAGMGIVAGGFGLLLVLAAAQLDARRSAEVARVRAETLAQTASIWLDGDAHTGLGTSPEKRLTDLAASLDHLLATSDFDGAVRTLRPKADAKTTLAAQPGRVRPNALEVVIQTGKTKAHADIDYRPEMGAALFEGKCTSVFSDDAVEAYAPVGDSWGATPAIVWVEGPASAPLWRRAVFIVAAALFAGLLASGAVWAARVRATRLAGEFSVLEAGLRELALGRMPGPISLTRRAPRELATMADALEGLRARLEAQANGQPLPPAPRALESASVKEKRAQLGEATEFDLALLVQQLVEPARKVAQSRKLEFQLVFPDGVPSRLTGYPMVLYKALDGLVRNGLRATDSGRVTLRVSNAGQGPEGWRLRFEVADSGPGVAFKDQQELAELLSAASLEDPNQIKEPLQQASALAHALGGELTFETQPGQGTRFGFTAAFQSTTPLVATGFHARPATAFQPRAVTGLQPGPATSFQPRQTLRAQ